eukprot:11004617-Ditylum_brightwellii.AAC.1
MIGAMLYGSLEGPLLTYFEQIELLEGVKQKSETIVVNDNFNDKKKPSSHCRKHVNSDKMAKGNQSKGSHKPNRT